MYSLKNKIAPMNQCRGLCCCSGSFLILALMYFGLMYICFASKNLVIISPMTLLQSFYIC